MSTVAAPVRPRLASARKIWLNIHLWFGLICGFLFALLGVTGCVLVLVKPILSLEVGRSILQVDGPGPVRTEVDLWIANAQRSFPELKAVDFVASSGHGSGGNAPQLGGRTADGKLLIVTLDPFDGRTLGNFVWDDRYTVLALRLHAFLAAPAQFVNWGRDIVAGLGVAMLVSFATGLYLWWPRNRNWRVALTFKRHARGRRRLIDLHNFIAVYLYVPLVILAITGIYFTRPDWIDPAIHLFSVPRTPDAAALAQASAPGACSARTTPGQAVALAQARFPAAEFVVLSIPRAAAQPYWVQLASAHNISDKGDTQVFVDRECPRILTVLDSEGRVAADDARSIAQHLHRNMMLGPIGQVIVFIAGLQLPLSFVTGVLLWLNRRKNRARAVNREQPQEQS